MAEVARGQDVRVEVARFEEWNDAGRRFDLLTCGDAWHWIEPKRGAAKVAQVLRPGGAFARFWNIQLLDEPVMAALGRRSSQPAWRRWEQPRRRRCRARCSARSWPRSSARRRRRATRRCMPPARRGSPCAGAPWEGSSSATRWPCDSSRRNRSDPAKSRPRPWRNAVRERRAAYRTRRPRPCRRGHRPKAIPRHDGSCPRSTSSVKTGFLQWCYPRKPAAAARAHPYLRC